MALHKLAWNALPPESCRHGALSIGNFDGVHRGHAVLVAELRRQAETVQGPAVVMTFDPHPSQLLRPGRLPPPLTTLPTRAQLLQEAGADEVVVLRTEADLLGLGAEDFFARVLRSQFDVRAMVEGTNFRFGRDRGGDVHTLETLCRQEGVAISLVAPQLLEGEWLSSSRVRDALSRGDVSEATRCLGRPYRLVGRVGTGQRRGKTLGFPTANLESVETLLPAEGVYAVRVPIGTTSWPGAANVGSNPTFGEGARKIEVHLIGFQGDLYGSLLTVEFLQRLRETRPFAGVSELVEQLRVDVEQARRIGVAAIPS